MVISIFKTWFTANGGFFHPDARFKPELSGFSIVADKDIPPDIEVVSCPFALAITPQVARTALSEVLLDRISDGDDVDGVLHGWSERQLMCSYICLHFIFDNGTIIPQPLSHMPYIKTLPRIDQLSTALHFNSSELEAFRGTNLYGATLDRLQTLKNEFQRCFDFLASKSGWWDIATGFTWTRYLAASTYISSRAFPSTLLSPTPSLANAPTSYPVLIPGVDALNHARAHPVSWVVVPAAAQSSPSSHTRTVNNDLAISLVIHTPTPSGAELLNNYGPKPNSELILGYGFTLPRNADDTIVLSIGGGEGGVDGKKVWEVGRDARGVEGLWEHIVDLVSKAPVNLEDRSNDDDDNDGETGNRSDACEDDNQLEAAWTLSDMCQASLDRLPTTSESFNIRPQVQLMLEHYLEGQSDILTSIIRFAERKEMAATHDETAL